ncbi:hypothetical protein [Paenibacillus amylolyticus]|uniref:hypothetical protein n=1 Tax=Paenibacillus amylolyticus TaxID=1451 RepID=UPI00249C0162|nr:hypothetical protein [Paenibacillus amylolyticus]WFA87248.1 hypothetical protein OGI70_10200 [Paenibacillus amylolyticus]
MFKSLSLIIGLSILSLFIISTGLYYFLQEKEQMQINEVIDISTNSLTFEDVDRLDQFSDLIIVGYAKDDFENREHIISSYEDGALQDFYTKTDIIIDQIIKKPDDFPENSKEITILEPLSLREDKKFTADGYTELEKGDNNIIFLAQNTFGDYGLINGSMGKFSLESNSDAMRTFTTQEKTLYQKLFDSILDKYDLN